MNIFTSWSCGFFILRPFYSFSIYFPWQDDGWARHDHNNKFYLISTIFPDDHHPHNSFARVSRTCAWTLPPPLNSPLRPSYAWPAPPPCDLSQLYVDLSTFTVSSKHSRATLFRPQCPTFTLPMPRSHPRTPGDSFAVTKGKKGKITRLSRPCIARSAWRPHPSGSLHPITSTCKTPIESEPN